MHKPKLIAVVGPTASGKTSLGIYLAQKVGGEIISADSRQVYKGLDIGTGKVTKREMAGVPHHLLDVISPKKQYSVDMFVKQATKAACLIYQTGNVPVLVGGTGLYIDTFVGRMMYAEVPPNETLRKKLARKTAPELFALLQKADPARAQTIEKGNPRRLIRALEIAKAIGKSPAPTTELMYDVLWIGLNPAPEKLKANIHKRLKARIKQGMVAEAKRLHKAGVSYKRMDELGLEYRYLARVLRNRRAPSASQVAEGALLQELEKAINDYAKRQVRWFTRNSDIHWVTSKTDALRLAKNFLSRYYAPTGD